MRIFDCIFAPLYYLVVILATIFFSIGSIIFGVLKIRSAVTWCVYWWGKTLLFPYFVSINGKEKLPTKAIYIGNHSSQFDIPLVCVLDPQIKFLSKIELKKVPLVGFAMEVTGHYLVDRKSEESRRRVIKKIINDRDSTIVLFPEGTRNKNPQKGLLEFKTGAFRIAKEAKLPLVLFYIQGAYQAFPSGKIIPRFFRKISISVIEVMEEADIKIAYDKLNEENRRAYGISDN